MRIRLKIDGTDLTSSLFEDWSIEDNAYGVLDNAQFTLDDPNNSIGVVEGKEVIIEDWSDNTVRYFGGVLTEVTRTTYGFGRRLACKALDWTFVLERALASETYRGKSDQYIIGENTASPKGIFEISDADLSDFDASTYVQEGIANTQFQQYKRENIRDIMDALAEAAGFVWWVDHFKQVHYQPLTYESHAFTLSDSPDDSTSFAAMALRHFRDISRLVNAVTVEGAYTRLLYDDLATGRDIYSADGVATKFVLEPWAAKEDEDRILVYRNTNTNASPTWTQKTVGQAGRDSLSDYDTLWDPGARTLEWASAPPNFANSFKIEGDLLFRLIQKEVDQASVDTFGREYGYSVRDESLTSEKEVELRAQAELRKRSGAAERITLRTTKDGIDAGKLLSVVNTTLGIDDDYLVTKVVTRMLGGTTAEYEVQLQAVPS